MGTEFRCPRCGFVDPTLAAASEALLAIGRERGVHATLNGIVDAVREVGSARCAALGIAGEHGELAQVIASGIAEETLGRGGGPRAPALLRATLQASAPVRVPDLREDPRAEDAPPDLKRMRSFLGVPLISGDAVLGALYLFGREDAPAFTAADQEAVQLLAPHAILAIDNARLLERSRELTVVEERNRLARELHDAVSQTLFSIVFTARSITTLLDRDPDAARRHVADLEELAQGAQREMRSLIFELRPADIEREGLFSTLRKHVDVLRRVHGTEIDLALEGEPPLDPQVEREVFRVAQEALSNAVKHSGATRVGVTVAVDGAGVRLEVRDDGAGFDARSAPGPGRLGLASIGERMRVLGGALSVESLPGAGTTILAEVPHRAAARVAASPDGTETP